MELTKKDCLEVLSTTPISNSNDLAPYIAAAVAEVFGGTVTCIEDKDPIGFYYLSPKNILSFVLFRDLDYKSWIDNPPTGVHISIDTISAGTKFISVCRIKTSKEEFVSSFTGDTEDDSEFISLLKSCLLFKRGSYLSEGMEFTDRMQLILPHKKEKSTIGLWGRLLGVITGERYVRSIDRCTR